AIGLLKLVVLPAALPVIVVLAVLYFVGFCTYAGVVLIREAREAKGVARNRMVAAACGALALSLTLIVALASTVGYVVAFAPPVLLKRAWREPALRSFLTRAAAISPHDPPETILHGLEVAITRAAPGSRRGLPSSTRRPKRSRSGATRSFCHRLRSWLASSRRRHRASCARPPERSSRR